MTDKTQFRRLKADARRSTDMRGHTLTRFSTFMTIDSPVYACRAATAHCSVCGAYVQVITNPRPNQIDIGGSAVAVNCSK